MKLYRGYSSYYEKYFYGELVVRDIGHLIYDGGYIKVEPESVECLTSVDENGEAIFKPIAEK